MEYTFSLFDTSVNGNVTLWRFTVPAYWTSLDKIERMSAMFLNGGVCLFEWLLKTDTTLLQHLADWLKE